MRPMMRIPGLNDLPGMISIFCTDLRAVTNNAAVGIFRINSSNYLRQYPISLLKVKSTPVP